MNRAILVQNDCPVKPLKFTYNWHKKRKEAESVTICHRKSISNNPRMARSIRITKKVSITAENTPCRAEKRGERGQILRTAHRSLGTHSQSSCWDLCWRRAKLKLPILCRRELYYPASKQCAQRRGCPWPEAMQPHADWPEHQMSSGTRAGWWPMAPCWTAGRSTRSRQ